MPSKSAVSAVFVHGLAKNPAPDKLKEIWLWGLSRDNPRPDVFAPPNKGIRLDLERTEPFFCYYADVFYGTDYEKDLDGYYELQTQEAELAAERLPRGGGKLA